MAPTDAEAIRLSLTEPGAFTTVFDRRFDSIHGYAARQAGPDMAEQAVLAGNWWGYVEGTVIGWATYLESAVVDEIKQRPSDHD